MSSIPLEIRKKLSEVEIKAAQVQAEANALGGLLMQPAQTPYPIDVVDEIGRRIYSSIFRRMTVTEYYTFLAAYGDTNKKLESQDATESAKAYKRHFELIAEFLARCCLDQKAKQDLPSLDDAKILATLWAGLMRISSMMPEQAETSDWFRRKP